MATEEEEYYDSIDDSEFEECRSFCNDKFREDDPDIDDEYSGKLNELVPFYMGNVEKSEIESTKTDTKSNSVTTLKNNKLKRRPPQMSLTDRRKNRSYLTMFYARAGQSGKNGPLNTSRATCAELTPKSNLEYESEQSLDFENADSEGLYSRFMEKEDTEENNDNPTTVLYKCESETTIGSKLHSVSEAQYSSCVSSRQRSKRDTGKGRTGQSLKLGELGGLGPNIAQEKMESLRRRQNYGKTVSEKNRIKFLENQVVRRLKQEIAKSNKF